MTDAARHFARTLCLTEKLGRVYQYRTHRAVEAFQQQVSAAHGQALICNFEPERAMQTLPDLHENPADRARLAELMRRIESDPRIDAESVTDEQRETFEKVIAVLGSESDSRVRVLRKAR
jgi:hypothetical protein